MNSKLLRDHADHVTVMAKTFEELNKRQPDWLQQYPRIRALSFPEMLSVGSAEQVEQERARCRMVLDLLIAHTDKNVPFATIAKRIWGDKDNEDEGINWVRFRCCEIAHELRIHTDNIDLMLEKVFGILDLAEKCEPAKKGSEGEEEEDELEGSKTSETVEAIQKIFNGYDQLKRLFGVDRAFKATLCIPVL